MDFDTPETWLRAAMRFSLSSTSRTSSIDDDSISSRQDADPGKSPRFRKIVEYVLFSRRFVATYNVVVLLLLLLIAALHWIQRLRQARRRRSRATSARKKHTQTGLSDVVDLKSSSRIYEAEDNGSSESSSTLQGTDTPPNDAKGTRELANEQSPLLPRKSGPHPKAPPIVHKIRAFLMYQPRPLPLINRSLPANGVSLIILAFLGLNAFYVFYRLPISLFMLFVFADRAALVFVANLPLLYLFAAKNQPIKWLTGYSYEALNIFHRRLGELMCFLALLHSAGMLGVWYTLLRPGGFTLARFLLSKLILLGLGAFVAYELIYFTSLGSFRQRWYELFLVLHVVLQIAALVLVWFHYHTSRPYVGAALAIFLIDRLVFRLGLKNTSLRASLTVLEDGETVLVSANWDIAPVRGLQRLLALNIKQGWKPTDHVFLTVPSISHKHVIQAHPFTIASAAPLSPSSSSNLTTTESLPGATRHAWLNFLIRARDGFSRDLLAHAHRHAAARIRLDGPYGSPSALQLLEDSDVAVVLAGGSGIAVAFPLVWALLHRQQNEDPESAGAGAGAGGVERRVCLLWVVHVREHLAWLPEERMDELRGLGLEVRIPEPTMEAGRPDVGGVLRRWVEEYASGGGEDGGGSVGVVVSGPDGMNRDARNTCAGLVREGHDVRVDVEKFGW